MYSLEQRTRALRSNFTISSDNVNAFDAVYAKVIDAAQKNDLLMVTKPPEDWEFVAREFMHEVEFALNVFKTSGEVACIEYLNETFAPQVRWIRIAVAVLVVLAAVFGFFYILYLGMSR